MSQDFINLTQAQTFLNNHFDTQPTDITLVGEGAWSRCFGFDLNNDHLVIRFGKYLDDFENDERAYRCYVAPDLPIPKVLEIGEAYDGYYAISERVYGTPLESANAEEWLAVVPSLVDAMEAMRTANLSGSSGFGGWGKGGDGSMKTWSEHLLAVDVDTPDRRTYGWRQRLAQHAPEGEETFVWGYELLQQRISDGAPRSLLHCDLINRNVLMAQGKISGVFDWGCSLYGDHLYELAWFEFWKPWYPEMDVAYLRSALEQRWQSQGYVVENQADRLAVCYLHIGLDHLAYNAYTGDWEALAATANQMKKLVQR